MSLFNLNEPNNYNARFNSLKSHSYEVWDGATQQFVPLTGGGGGGDPTPLPYYLKENEIRIQNNTTGAFSIMDPANFAIDGGTAGVGITKDMLMFADSTGSSTLNKPKLDLLTQLTQPKLDLLTQLTQPKLDVLTQIKTDIVDAAETSGTQSTFIGYNPTTKKFLKNTSLSVVNPASTIERSLINYAGLYCYLTGSRYTSMSATQIQALNGSNYINLLASATPTSNALTISANSVTRSLNIDDIIVTNNLKALASKTVDANSKMMIYDNTTGIFNYTTIPAGGGTTYGKQYKASIPETRFQNAAILGVANNYPTIAASVSGSYATAPYFDTFNTPGNELFIVAIGMSRNKWYGIRFPKDVSGGINTTYSFKVYPGGPITGGALSDERFDVVKVNSDIVGSYTIKAGTWFIRFNETREVPTLFNGTIHITCLNQNQYDLPELTFT